MTRIFWNEKVDEGNEIIAKFLGWYQPEDAEYLWFKKSTDGFGANVVYDIRFTPHRNLPFQRDWNYLMEAIEKIEDLDSSVRLSHGYSIEITGNGTTAYRNEWGHGEDRIIHRENCHNRRLFNTWVAVIEFIRWYNNGKKKVVPEDVCACPDGGQYLDGYYDTHCDRCKKKLP